MEVKEEGENAGLKLNIQKTKILASSPIASWQIDGETMETVIYFIFLASKITSDGDCTHEIKRCLLLGRKAVTNLDSLLNSRDITLLTKVHLVKPMFFPVVMYGCESWTIKNNERWRTDAFQLWCWRSLESSLDYKKIKPVNSKGNQSWIFIGRTDGEAETPILWLPDAKNWLWKIPWCWERLKVEGKGGSRGWDGWMTSLTRWTWVWASSRSWRCIGKPGMKQSIGSPRVRHDWVTELNWM